jgi:hypothetical protein
MTAALTGHSSCRSEKLQWLNCSLNGKINDSALSFVVVASAQEHVSHDSVPLLGGEHVLRSSWGSLMLDVREFPNQLLS